MSDLLEPCEEEVFYHVVQHQWIPLVCCHCSLTHEWYFKYKDGKIFAKCRVDDRCTAQFRRNKVGDLFSKHKKWALVRKERGTIREEVISKIHELVVIDLISRSKAWITKKFKKGENL